MANTHSLDLELSSSQYASITDGSQTGLDFAGDFTIEAWVKIEQLPTTSGTSFIIAGKENFGVSQESYNLRILSSDKLEIIYSGDGSANTSIVSDAVVVVAADVGKWVHFAGSVDVSGSTGVLYKNGGVVASTPSGSQTSVFNSTASFAIGAHYSSGTAQSFFDGLVDEVRVYSDIRTSLEINHNMHVETPVGDNLVGHWKLQNDYTDSSGNGNTLTASGSPVFSTDTVEYSLIRRDSSESSSITSTVLTYSHTCTGSNLILFVTVICSGSNTISSVTYNGTTMGLATDTTSAAQSQDAYLYFLKTPDSGANDIVITVGTSGFIYSNSSSYIGASQSPGLDAVNSDASTTTSKTTSVTTVGDDAWLVLGARAQSTGNTAAGTNTSDREDNAGFTQLYDSNGLETPAGSFSLQTTQPSEMTHHVMASFIPEPVGGVGSGGNPMFFSSGGVSVG